LKIIGDLSPDYVAGLLGSDGSVSVDRTPSGRWIGRIQITMPAKLKACGFITLLEKQYGGHSTVSRNSEATWRVNRKDGAQILVIFIHYTRLLFLDLRHIAEQFKDCGFTKTEQLGKLLEFVNGECEPQDAHDFIKERKGNQVQEHRN